MRCERLCALISASTLSWVCVRVCARALVCDTDNSIMDDRRTARDICTTFRYIQIYIRSAADGAMLCVRSAIIHHINIMYNAFCLAHASMCVPCTKQPAKVIMENRRD